MATYIPGATSYMPEFKPFTPDYKFLSSVLDIKTNRYNTNYQQLNDLYSKIVYAPLSRQDTQSMRDQYTAGLSDKLQKISGMDLSLVQNVDAAKAVFKPFFEEDIIVGDMVRTKAYQNEKAFANRLMNDPDRTRREMWWMTGVKAMDYQMQDFINASPEDALNMPIPKYVPDADLYELAGAVLAESGLSIKRDELGPNGQFIITRENGDLVTGPALELVQRTLYDDPRVQQAYFTQSYVDSRDTAQEMLNSGAVKSIDEGQRAWALKTINEYTTKAASKKIEEKEKTGQAIHSNKSWEIFRESKGIIPGSQQEREMREQFSVYEALRSSTDRNNNIIAEGVMPTTTSSTQDLLGRAYNMQMQFNIKDDMIAAARNYGNINASTTIKMENPEYARNRKFEYDVALEGIKQTNRLNLALYKSQLDGKGMPGILSGLTLSAKPGTAGNITFIEDGANEGGYDIVATNKRDILEFDNLNVQKKLLNILTAAPLFQPGVKDNMYTFMINGEERRLPIGNAASTSGGTLYEILNSKDDDGNFLYKDDIVRIYNQYNSYLNPSEENADALTKQFPHLAFAYDESKGGDDATKQNYLILKNQFKTSDQFNDKLEEGVRKYNNHLYDSYKLIMNTGDFAELGDAELFTGKQSGVVKDGKLPTDFLFTSLGDGNWRLKTQDEFIKEFVEKAKAGKIDNADITWYNKLFQANKSYKDTDMMTGFALGGGGPMTTVGIPMWNWFGISKKFVPSEAEEDAAKIYNLMYTALNKSQGAELAPEIEEILTKGGDYTDLTVTGNASDPFKTFNFTQYMRGREYLGSVGDLIINPKYSVDVEPSVINSDPNAAGMVMDIVMQLNNTPNAQMTVQGGDLGMQEGADFNAASDPIAMDLFNYYLRTLKSFSVNPDQPESNRPVSTITYNNVYGAPKEPGKDHAAYVINLPHDFVKEGLSLIKAGDTTGSNPAMITNSELARYSTLTFAFDKDIDMSVRREGMYNYSYVQDQINTNNNKMYSNSYANGGTMNVYQDVNGQHMASITYKQYDGTNKENNFVDLPTKTFNLNQWIASSYKGGTIESHLDSAVKYFEMTIEDKMIANNKLYEADSKQNGVK